MRKQPLQQISAHPGSRVRLILAALILLLAAAGARAADFPRAAEIERIAAALEETGVTVSLYAVRDGTAPRTLDIRGDIPSNPASVQKIFTTGAGLLELGPDFRFETRLLTTAPLAGGELPGPLVIVGEGDPSLAGRWNDKDPARPLKQWAAALKAAGVARLGGDIIGLDEFFAEEPFAPGWDEYTHTDWYTAPVSALSLNDNCIDIRIHPGTGLGTAPRLSLVPDTSYVSVTNNMTTKARRSGWIIHVDRPVGTNNITLGGRAAHGQSSRVEYVTIHNPTLFTATVFHEILEAEGLEVDGAPLDYDQIPPAELRDRGLLEPSGWITLATHSSPPLSDVLVPINENSQNLYAELLLKRLGVERKGAGTFAAGTDAVRDIWSQAGLDVSRLSMVDGSGLSRQNLTTPRTVVEALRIMDGSPYRDLYRHSLAVAGYEGSMHSRFDGTRLAKKLLGKTGYLNGTRTLAGYFPARDGSEVTFAIFLQGPTGAVKNARKEMDEMVALLGE